ncbi:MAG: Crossover junction endodeoxyribonuclease RuvC [Parcubacteria group bacterium GW2011_GWB1_44_7]|nr:MAG: Crossover junction endodeoxyribonuclease RuvC [Parcubacteria group bacterium GW2011_GWB1_44_7]
MKIIAIDPGYERLGIAILENADKPIVIFSCCFKTLATWPHQERLAAISEKIDGVIKKWQPTELAIEKLFFNVNQKTALKVAEARGVILNAGAEASLIVAEYTPLQVKIAVTGYGRGDKKQVIDMVSKLAEFNPVKPRGARGASKKTISDDEMDAVAIGLTHLACRRNPRGKKL